MTDERMNWGITLQQRVDQQRVKHIIDSFQLVGPDHHCFDDRLKQLFAAYPSTWLELAMAEVLVVNWLIVPMPRGLEVLHQVHNVLLQWQLHGITNLLTEAEFQRITGLDPAPVFHSLRLNALLKLEAEVLSHHR
ncbi:hypothetical protein IQ266_15840 [filamentous cyanobacterium LEGE 11480]|uniref:Uncharacterized protein n=1 Tax=Romeriopsis navalis LEGE 11480 TaxID=2777977 RepID=A0A928VMD4_9CYAN|nr:hypothetical protein [Romeriopsis navalis]MBE9031206.1 hypothetical protein [Romeriopsis navalis LEGE 11480]